MLTLNRIAVSAAAQRARLGGKPLATTVTSRWPSSSIDWRRVSRVATAALVVSTAASLASVASDVVDQWGNDYEFFVGVAQRWVATGGFYGAEQLAGPYVAATGVSVLYPPIALYLFVPFTVLPAFLWWAIPLGIVAWHVVTARPAWWAWPVIALLLFAPRSQSIIIWGNTGIWVTAFVALGLRFAWASPLVLLKPTLAPFALIGIRRRSWWVGLVVLLAASLLLLPHWFEYIAAMRNNVGAWPPGFLYSLPDCLLVAVPIVAWVARRERAVRRRTAAWAASPIATRPGTGSDSESATSGKSASTGRAIEA